MSPEKEPHVGQATLDWNADRGFVLHLEAESEGVRVVLHEVPVPADGTDELAEGVELDKLEVLFKADADVDGTPGQVLEASLQAGDTEITLRAKVEEAESGAITHFVATMPMDLHGNPPVSGGPRPVPQSEDELDWDDETTYEKLFADAFPKGPPTPKEAVETAPADRGLAALLKALAEPNAPDDEDYDEDEAPDLGGADLTDTADAMELIKLLVESDQLALEEGADLAVLAELVSAVLSGNGDTEARAEALAAALISAPGVEELFADDDDLERLIERW